MTLASDVENIGPIIFTIMKNIEMHTLQKASQLLKVYTTSKAWKPYFDLEFRH